jgi:hypothetical protein
MEVTVERGIEDPFLQDYFQVLEAFVFMGMRCPGDREILRQFRKFKHQYPEGMVQNPGAELARQGFLTIEIAGRNWRTITLHHGPLAGQSSLPCPSSAAPYRVIAADHVASSQRLALNILERKIERAKQDFGRRRDRLRRTILSIKALRQKIASMEEALQERMGNGEA